MARIFLITGGSGFTAETIAAAAVRHGFEVRRMSRDAVGIPGVLEWSADPEKLSRQLTELRPEVIFHGAGSASVGASLTNPEADREASVGTWSTLLEALHRSGLRPLIFFPSSAAVYGNPARLPVREEDPLSPLSPYGRHKLECEDLARTACREWGMRIVVLRLFSLFGVAQKRLLVREIYEQAAGGNPEISLAGTGEETRDYLSAYCFGEAVIHLVKAVEGGAADHFQSEQEPWIFNLASGEETRILDLATMISGLLETGKPVHCRHEPRPGDPRRWVADVGAFRKVCPDWNPRPFKFALAEVLREWENGANPT